MHKVLILGGSGLVGTAAINEMSKHSHYEVYSTYLHNPALLNQDRNFKLDIKEPDCLDNILSISEPNIIVSCLRGDFDKQLAAHVKAAEYLKQNGGSLYFFSTTNVFDNDLSRPHYEDDLPNSQTDYGQYKLECEKRIVDILGESACILRLPQVWGKNSQRLKGLFNSINNNEEITVYPKLFHNTNTDVMIARQLCYIIENNLKGIFHLAAEDFVNYKDFYHELITGLGFNDAKLVENYEEEGYFALLSKRYNEFPEELRVTNKSVIEYLTN